MRWVLLGTLLLATRLAVGASESATPFTQIDAAMEAARQNQMPLLAPLAWEKAIASLRPRAKTTTHTIARRSGRPNTSTRQRAALAGATDTLRVGRINFGAVLTSRTNALSAGADKLVPKIYANAEAQFRKAAVSSRTGPLRQIAIAGGRGGGDLSNRRTRGDQGRDSARRAASARASRRRERREIRAANAGAGARFLRGGGTGNRRGPLRHRSRTLARQAGEGTGEPCVASRSADQRRERRRPLARRGAAALAKRRWSISRSHSARRRT